MNLNHFPILWQQPKVYLCRHATPDWSRTDIRYDIPPGPPLTAHGESEASKLGEFLKNAGVGKIYHSPLERTKRTAQLAAEIIGISVIEEEAVREWTREETSGGVLSRFRPFWESVVQESTEGMPIAIVTHGGPIASLLADLMLDAAEMNFYKQQFDHGNPVPPAGVWLTTRSSHDVRWQLELVFTPQPAKRYQAQTIFV